MKHTSVKMDSPCELINITPCNPLISKCQIKVLYVSDEPNRNGSIINRDTAIKMANSLPGNPIVGYYNKDEQDYEEHNREILIEDDGKVTLSDATRPYGFVDLNAKVWFQKFLDDNEIEREYLMTEGYIWTGQYPEAERIIAQGNNQSMELDNKTLDAEWAKDSKGNPQFFIINDAIISKLCILGEDYEPCFEGASITKVQFSLNDKFKEEFFTMVSEVQNLLNKGGAQMLTTYTVKVGDSLWMALYSFIQEKEYASIEAVFEDGERKFAVIKDVNDNVYSLDFSVAEDGAIQLAEEVVAMDDYTPAEEPQFSLEEIEAFKENLENKDNSENVEEYKKENDEDEDKKDESDNSNSDVNTEDENSESSDEDEEDEKKKYILEEIPEYIELASKFSELENKYNLLSEEKENLEKQLQPLVEFKASAERKEKEEVINSFYMLSDEDKKDVMENIDNYSLHDIEAELSIICVRNKVSFNTLEDDEQQHYTFSFEGGEVDSTPAWVKAVLDTAKTLN